MSENFRLQYEGSFLFPGRRDKKSNFYNEFYKYESNKFNLR